MPIKATTKYIKAGQERLNLPPEAELFKQGMEQSLNQGDYIKVAVISKGGIKEIFWAKFVKCVDNLVFARVANDLFYTHAHGLVDNDWVTVALDEIHAVLKE